MGVALHVVSGRLFRLNYEYRRLGLIGGVAVVIYVASLMIPRVSLVADISIKLVLLGVFPLFLTAAGFLSARELRVLRRLPSKVFGTTEPDA
jgi:hypothetical protein